MTQTKCLLLFGNDTNHETPSIRVVSRLAGSAQSDQRFILTEICAAHYGAVLILLLQWRQLASAHVILFEYSVSFGSGFAY